MIGYQSVLDVTELKADAAAGKISVEGLIDVIVVQQKRIEQLEAQIKSKNPTDRLDQAFSEKAEEKRSNERKGKAKNKSRRRPLRRGRITTADKIKLDQRTEQVFPENVSPQDCKLSHTRVAWRLENGKAVLIAYEIYRCGNSYGKPAGLLGRSEFGIEITVALAYQVFCLGLSLDKACAVLSFFEQIKLRKSQADALNWLVAGRVSSTMLRSTKASARLRSFGPT